MDHKWNRTCIAEKPVRVRDSLRYYIDGVRSDGSQFRSGIDVVPGSLPEAEIHKQLRSSLDYFLPKAMRTTKPGSDAHKGESGWTEEP